MLQVFQANRIETLFEILCGGLQQPLSRPLAGDTVVVPSKGMGRWLTLRIADRYGICSNVRFVLPASFLWDLTGKLLGVQSHVAPFAAEVLVWRILRWLSESDAARLAPRLANYLGTPGPTTAGGSFGDPSEQRRWQLAQRIAGVFDQYLIYRPDWLAAWESSRSVGLGLDEDWQAELWRHLTSSALPAHRAALLAEVAQRLRNSPNRAELPERLMLFGLSALPPAFLNVVTALAAAIPTALLVLNPCAEAWGDIRDPQELARASPEEAGAAGHPLLAAWGKQGREFFDTLLELEANSTEVFDSEDPAPVSALAVLQHDIRFLRERSPDQRATVMPGDRSVTVHNCHSPLREIEVLHDQLLALLQARPDLDPSDIAVLAPDIGAYAPLIEAVFAPRSGQPTIPFGIADRSLAESQALAASFVRLLQLPDTRCTVDDVLGLLDEPAIARRAGLPSETRPLLRRWLLEADIRWGIDAAHRQRLGLPAAHRHTWRAGLQRLLLGYAMPPVRGAWPLFKGCYPVDPAEGSMAALLGQFAAFAETLFEWIEAAHSPRPLTAWIDLLAALCDRLYQAGDDDLWTLQAIRETLWRVRDCAEPANFGAPLGLPTVRACLVDALAQTDSGGGFLAGGVTFGTLVPMRSLPFRVICVLGLNDGALPRQHHPPGFDLMAQHPRRGDRARRHDDRYLFLETLLSAREVLYLSYIGRSVRDNTELPPSVLLAELLETLDRSCLTERSWITNHPLQPFSPEYFSQIPALPSFAGDWLAAARTAGRGTGCSAPLLSAPLATRASQTELTLDELIDFFANPARYFLKNRLGVALPIAERELPEHEPVDLPNGAQRQALQTAWLVEQHGWPEHAAEDWLNAAGLLPPGTLGQAAVRKLLQANRAELAFLAAELPTDPVEDLAFELALPNGMLSGRIRSLHLSGRWSVRLESYFPDALFGEWIRHLALCAADRDPVPAVSILLGLRHAIRLPPLSPSTALDYLQYMFEIFRRAEAFPPAWFPESSYQFAKAAGRDLETARKAATKAWTGNDYQRGENADPWRTALYRGLVPLDAEFEALAVDLWQPLFDRAEGQLP